jgi:hypothetical protein
LNRQHPLGKQPLFHHILETAWRQCAAILFIARQFLAQPRHRPIKVMQVKTTPPTTDVAVIVASILSRRVVRL